MTLKTCPNCGTEFETDVWNKVYCRPECATEANKIKARKPRTVVKAVCAWCKTEFEIQVQNQFGSRYCTRECRGMYRAIKRRIMNIFQFNKEAVDRELNRLRELGCKYTFPEGYEDLNGLYRLGES